MKNRFVIRGDDGEFKASYANLSEANTYLLHSFPNAKWEEPQGEGFQQLEVKDDEGKTVAILEVAKA